MKKGIINVVIGVLGQLVILALGILVPRFVLQSYGDEANGLINAIGQIFTYLALIEAGVGQAALQALYGPVAKADYKSTNEVMSETHKMFCKLTNYYIAFVVLTAVIYPLFVHVSDTQNISFFGSTYWAIFAIIFIQGFSNAVTFYVVSTLRQLLIADGYNYIIVNITTLVKVLTAVLRIVLINMKINLVLLQVVYLVLAIIEMLIYKVVIRKKYPWLELNNVSDTGALKQRNAFVVHEICNVIFSSTDVLVLSIFCDLKVASIYAIYNLIFSAINTLINQIHSGCFYILGQTYNKDKQEYVKVHDIYDTYYIAFVFALISTVYMFIIPFVKLYTDGVTEINYIDKWLPPLFCFIQLLSCCRITSSNLIKIAGHAKQTVTRAIIEAVINLGVSLILVHFIGIYGVLLGTIFALLYRTNDMIVYANVKILKRKPIITYKTIIINGGIFCCIVAIQQVFQIKIDNYMQFFLFAGLFCLGAVLLYFGVNTALSKTARQFVKKTFSVCIKNR